jgi:NitT/TauT family transport system substrate-binding protein
MRRTFIAIIAVIVVVALALGAWYFLSLSKPYAGRPESIVVGLPSPAESSALVYIADDQHFFADNGLNVTIKGYDTGIHAVNDMLEYKNPDIAVAAEYILVGKVFEKKNLSGIATISRQDIFYLVGRRDHGIKNVSDLKGKNIGVPAGTIAGFYCGRYLQLHNISMDDVTFVDTQPAQFEDAIVNGSVDAVAVWGTYASSLEDRLGSNAVIFPDQSGQLVYWVAICRDDWIGQHPETINRFLKALDQAAMYASNDPAGARAILKERLHSDDAYVEKVWSNSQYSLSLDQSLITAMEDESRWMINNHLTGEKQVPIYRDYFFFRGLEEVKPGSVNIIH